MSAPLSETKKPPEPGSGWRQFGALIRLRCPRCHKGRLFRGWFAMNDPCPVCGLIIQREEGYFLGAMYVSYLLGGVLLGAGYYLGTLLLPRGHDHIIMAGLFLLYLPLTPFLFRYSRGVWIYIDRWVCPGDTSAGAFEKVQAGKRDEQAGPASPVADRRTR
jgi:uncharacterized protein (DUF983 family)